jgi:hypothetical protein
VGAELVHADGQTDLTKLTADFRNFANAPKIQNFGNTNLHPFAILCLLLTFVNSIIRTIIRPQELNFVSNVFYLSC